ncbi:MAG: sensor domain-containing diguanylate cyclase [Acidobacteria bacterium]|nr:sensor domain-containing diguanylate cyclase [Acidobacteriota bacterium]
MKPGGGSLLEAGPPAARKGGTGRKDLLKSLLEIASALTSKEDLPGVLGAITRELSLLVPIDQASIALLEEGASQLSLRLTYCRGETLFPTEGKQIALSMDNPLGWSVLNRKPLWRNDVPSDLRFQDAPSGDDMKSEMVAPLLIHERTLGTLNLASASERAFTAADFEVLQRCAQLVAVAVENSQLYRLTREMSLIDSLTGIYNHRHFKFLLGVEVGRAERYSRLMALMMIDVDNFKKINDTLGHPIGDQVLRGVAKILGEGLRRSDVLARYGGEEFAVILQETEFEAARGVAEKLCRDVESRATFPDGRGEQVRATVSIGLAFYPTDAKEEAALLSLADAALYRAKQSGKNRISL